MRAQRVFIPNVVCDECGKDVSIYQPELGIILVELEHDSKPEKLCEDCKDKLVKELQEI